MANIFLEWGEQMSNRELLQELVGRNAIALRMGEIFDTSLPPLPEVNADRVAGMMLGLAVGDALGNTSEGMNPATRRAQHGEIRDYLPNRYADWQRTGMPSDDSQMAFWTLEHLIEDGEYVPDRLAHKFCSSRIFGIGSAVREFVSAYRSGRPWHEAGTRSAGNGALMRIAPMIYPHVARPGPDLWADTALSAMTTHNDGAAIASCVSFVALLWELLGVDNPPSGDSIVEQFCDRLASLDDGSDYWPRGGAYAERSGSFATQVRHMLNDASARGLSCLDACESFFSGAYLLETVPCVLYILREYLNDPEQAILRAVNDTRDNDTIAAIVGAAVGALHGRSALPSQWVENLNGRTRESDDGRMFELLSLGEERFLRP